jgi:hypothetical protein
VPLELARSLDKYLLRFGTQIVTNLTNNAGKDNLKPDSTVLLMILLVGKMLLKVFLAI